MQEHKLPDRVASLVALINAKLPMHTRALREALAVLDSLELGRLESYLAFCQEPAGLSLDYVSDCYLTLVRDTLNEQMFFQRTKRYRHSSLAAVANDVYFNHEYMSRNMYGLAITYFFWPNHRSIVRFFEETLPRDRRGKYLEVGPGPGAFFVSAMKTSLYDEFVGIDLSQASVSMTKNLIEHSGVAKTKEWSVVVEDFLDAEIPGASCNAVVMGEVLEHVERPDALLSRVAEIASASAHIFVTTCCNAPAIDHIFLFRDVGSVEALFAAAGLSIKARLILPTPGKTLEECTGDDLPVNLAFVLEKRNAA